MMKTLSMFLLTVLIGAVAVNAHPHWYCVDKEDWCGSQIHRDPGSCYERDMEMTCCASCRRYERSVQGCRYGDVHSGCRRDWQYCSTHLDDCCATCSRPTTCQDKADWCPGELSNNPSFCYQRQVELTCCATCRRYQRSTAGCRFGDQHSWCRRQECESYDKPWECCASC